MDMVWRDDEEEHHVNASVLGGALPLPPTMLCQTYARLILMLPIEYCCCAHFYLGRSDLMHQMSVDVDKGSRGGIIHQMLLPDL